jgi:SAM-dependent methyltransferase
MKSPPTLASKVAFRLRAFRNLCRVISETSAFAIPSLRKVKCNICGWRGKKFADYDCGFGIIFRDTACPRCRSHPRHRSLHLYLHGVILCGRRVRLLHFAPEPSLTPLLRSHASVDYLSVDIDPAQAMQKEDITRLSFRDQSFDVIICMHVLEHVEDDGKAMKEIHRVLKTEGFAILDVPIDNSRERTYEDYSIRSPEGRAKAFWQGDHVRLYGRDFSRRLEEAGFSVQEDQYIKSLGEDSIRFHGLQSTPFFICTREEPRSDS